MPSITRLLPLSVLLLCAAASHARMQPPAPREACDASTHASVLQAAGPIDARAHALDRRRLLWPGKAASAGTRFVLHHAAHGLLRIAQGERVRGEAVAGQLGAAITALPLALDAAALPPALQRRFAFAGEGVRLRLAIDDARRLRALHRGQLVLTHEDASGRVLDATAVQAAGALDDLYATAEAVRDLGAHPRRDRTDFKLWAPSARGVWLCLHETGDSAVASMRPLKRDARTGVWHTRLPSDQSGHYFTYVVEVFARGHGWVRNRVTEPYALSLTTDSRRAWIGRLDAPATQPPGWAATPRPTRVAHAVDMAIYELHVRDFSAGDASVSAAHRGKYMAFTETQSLGMQHLKRLSDAGITDVHFLPIFDLATVPERGCVTPALPDAPPDSEAQQAVVMKQAQADCYNWGYDPWHFTAPEGSFATDAADGAARVRELRAMVQALHRLNLRVGMDMVYNHTTASGQHARSVLDRIVPGYYQRLNAKGQVETSTCCDNTATEHRMMAKLMIDSAVVWARDYRIDSFRFDLMGHQPREAMERLSLAVNRASGRRVDLIGEGWNFGEVENGKRFVQAAQGRLNGSGIGTFSDRARDAARGSGWGGPDEVARNKGWIHGEGTAAQADLLRVGLAGTLDSYLLTDRRGARVPASRIDYNGQGAGYASQPSEVVNYVENHDNQTLFDNNLMKLPRATSGDDRARVQHLGNALVAFSQGIAYFHAGQEILRSKSLDRNSYDSGDAFNRLDWSLTDNGFGTGLPPERDNKDHWSAMRPLLADAAAIKPTSAQIAWTRDAFLDLLRIRASTSLLRLKSADEVQRRLAFFNTGPAQNPRLVVGHLDGAGLADANFRELVYLLNASAEARDIVIETLKGKPFVPHPVHTAPGAADARAAAATWAPGEGRFSVPARTAVVFVVR
jgi:pullulanase